MHKYISGIKLFRCKNSDVIEIYILGHILTITENKQRIMRYEKMDECPFSSGACLHVSMTRRWNSFSCKHCFFDYSDESEDTADELTLMREAFAFLKGLGCKVNRTPDEETNQELDNICQKHKCAGLLLKGKAKEQKQFKVNPRVEPVKAKYEAFRREYLLPSAALKREKASAVKAAQAQELKNMRQIAASQQAVKAAQAQELKNMRQTAASQQRDDIDSRGTQFVKNRKILPHEKYFILSGDFPLRILDRSVSEDEAIHIFDVESQKVSNLKMYKVVGRELRQILP